MKRLLILAFLGIVVVLSSCSKGRTKFGMNVTYKHEKDWIDSEKDIIPDFSR